MSSRPVSTPVATAVGGLARAFRPRRFAEVVGQEHVREALQAMVARDHDPATLLIAGPSGVGKTTLARLYASGMNCIDQFDGEPCGDCASCEAIWTGGFRSSVLEVDGATRRGIEDARKIADIALHSVDGWRVIIIDEAHQLTRAASTALLKTLEEPPIATSFVLLTTAPGDLLPAIRSRAIKFMLAPVDEAALRQRLAHIASVHGLAVDAGRLTSITSGARGSVRTAINMLERAALGDASDGDESEVTALRVLAHLATRDFPSARKNLESLAATLGPRGALDALSEILDAVLTDRGADAFPLTCRSEWDRLERLPRNCVLDAQIELDRIVVPAGPDGLPMLRRRMAPLMNALAPDRREPIADKGQSANPRGDETAEAWWTEQTCPRPTPPSRKGDLAIGGMRIGPKPCDKPRCPVCASGLAERDLASVKRSGANAYLSCRMPLSSLDSADPRKRVRGRMKSASNRLPGASWAWFATQVVEEVVVEAAIRVDQDVSAADDVRQLGERIKDAFPKDTSIQVSALDDRLLESRFLRSLRELPSLSLNEAWARIEEHIRWNGLNVVQTSHGFWLDQGGRPLEGAAKRRARQASRRQVG